MNGPCFVDFCLLFYISTLRVLDFSVYMLSCRSHWTNYQLHYLEDVGLFKMTSGLVILPSIYLMYFSFFAGLSLHYGVFFETTFFLMTKLNKNSELIQNLKPFLFYLF